MKSSRPELDKQYSLRVSVYVCECVACTRLNRIGVVWWKADTRVKLWLPPSEFQGTGALRPHPDGAVYPREASRAPRDMTDSFFFLGSPLSAGWGWQEAVPGPLSSSHTSFCTWFTISFITQVLI